MVEHCEGAGQRGGGGVIGGVGREGAGHEEVGVLIGGIGREWAGLRGGAPLIGGVEREGAGLRGGGALIGGEVIPQPHKCGSHTPLSPISVGLARVK